MSAKHSFQFLAKLDIIGINPFVYVPDNILKALFKQAEKDKGPIPICGSVNDTPYRQTLVKYSGAWRLYINTSMLKNSPKRIGESVKILVSFDRADRSIKAHPKLIKVLQKQNEAKKVFDALTPSLKKEIVRYISHLKSEESVDRNIAKAIDFLLGKGSFVGRDKV
ncbi:MAG: YdeI/OmpD-associated family protein [Bacteroidetes bacterium]|nr:YdeI/OmpD-associated family protein [Bacteroidota bacterium]MBS1539551.1 YdeI/OmpD-associated family protein [Bacteroidota bacterium]